ncbi:transmembrane 4 L6 family member 1 isoform X2 [Cavia porcellus]|uniref:transmembrane 4 L6 family member 1 isoform X2 n=1 Tax=Cavia porcellus TaxID=10141 RepID=UPI000350B181|nr:transmembrane 4 L6 family member 1 isoform X2 [Cavia porcellus]
MCYGKCARCIGHSLVWLAVLCIVANILLYFPNGETKYASENNLSRYVWFFGGIAGGGLLMFLPAIVFMMLEEEEDCCGCCGHDNCGKRCAMFSSIFAAFIGLLASGYCVTVASLGLGEGPWCLDSLGQWNYTFANTNGQYLMDSSTWSQCKEPKHIVEWNVTLFSLLLAFGGIEFIFCLIQIINGLLGGICGYCCSRQQVRTCEKMPPGQNHKLPLFHCNLYMYLYYCKTLYCVSYSSYSTFINVYKDRRSNMISVFEHPFQCLNLANQLFF